MLQVMSFISEIMHPYLALGKPQSVFSSKNA